MQEPTALSSRGRGTLGVVLERRPQCAVSPEVRRRGQCASRGAPGKSGLHASGEGERVIAPEPWEGHLASRRVEEGLSRSFSGGGRKPWVPSTCAGDLRGLLMVALRSQGNWRWEGPLGTPRGLVHWKRASSPVEAGTAASVPAHRVAVVARLAARGVAVVAQLARDEVDHAVAAALVRAAVAAASVARDVRAVVARLVV